VNGGLPRDWIYLVQGAPGTGKTTLGLQFLLEGGSGGLGVGVGALARRGHLVRSLGFLFSWERRRHRCRSASTAVFNGVFALMPATQTSKNR